MAATRPDRAARTVSRRRLSSTNLRTQVHRFIFRAGWKPWPRTFQNLRASRETELSAVYPLRTIGAWLGNSQPVAMEHYLSVRDEDFTRAAQMPVGQTAQKTAQSDAEQSALSAQSRNPTPADGPENADLLVLAGTDNNVPENHVAPRGFEPLLPG